MDDKIRVYVYIPTSGDGFFLWLNQDTVIGPPVSQKNRFTDIWGSDAEENGPYAGKDANKPKGKGLAGMLKENALSKQKANFADAMATSRSSSAGFGKSGLSKLKAAAGLVKAEVAVNIKKSDGNSLKSLIERVTGISPVDQRLYFNYRRIEFNESTLREYGIGHGATVSLSQKETHDGKVNFLATTARKMAQSHNGSFVAGRLEKACKRNKAEGSSWMLPKWHHNFNPKLLNMAGFQTVFKNFEGVDYFDYTWMNDGGHHDVTKDIRGMFDTQLKHDTEQRALIKRVNEARGLLDGPLLNSVVPSE